MSSEDKMLETVEHTPLSDALDQLDKSTEAVKQMPTKDDISRARKARKRIAVVTVAAVALIAIAALVVASILIPRLSAVEQGTAINTGSIRSLEQAREQLKQAGVPEDQLPPVVAAPEAGAPVDVDALVNATAATILAKIRTDPAYRGAAGLQGEVGPIGKTGDPGASPACLSTPTQCQGANGNNGKDGQNGIDGSDGQNGINGKDGIDGKDGKDGVAGPPGPACPDGYSQQTVLVPNPDITVLEPTPILACVQGG